MRKLSRVILAIMIAVCLVASIFALGACNNGELPPNFVNPPAQGGGDDDGGNNPPTPSDRYTVTVMLADGTTLNGLTGGTGGMSGTEIKVQFCNESDACATPVTLGENGTVEILKSSLTSIGEGPYKVKVTGCPTGYPSETQYLSVTKDAFTIYINTDGSVSDSVSVPSDRYAVTVKLADGTTLNGLTGGTGGMSGTEIKVQFCNESDACATPVTLGENGTVEILKSSLTSIGEGPYKVKVTGCPTGYPGETQYLSVTKDAFTIYINTDGSVSDTLPGTEGDGGDEGGTEGDGDDEPVVIYTVTVKKPNGTAYAGNDSDEVVFSNANHSKTKGAIIDENGTAVISSTILKSAIGEAPYYVMVDGILDGYTNEWVELSEEDLTITLTASVPETGDDDEGDDNEEERDVYRISVLSTGGLKLNNVKVTASKNGTAIKSGISIRGVVELELPLDEYTLTFENLPQGYEESTETHVTSADSFEYTVRFDSKVIDATAPQGYLYSLGDVMYNFDCVISTGGAESKKVELLDLVDEYDMIMLNFWYKNCGPCRAEFPAIENAYTAYSSKVAILALSNQDNLNTISDFQDELGLSFMMGQDSSNLGGHFGVSAYPTTVVIDKFGTVAYVHSGSITNENTWKALFDHYTSPTYAQEGSTNDGEEGDGPIIEQVKPDVEMTDSAIIESAINGDNFSATYYPDEDEYIWPWVIRESDNGDYITAANTGVDGSYAIILARFTAQANMILKLDYNISTEEGCDEFHVVMDNIHLASFSGNSNGWQTAELHVFNKTTNVQLVLAYQKDGANYAGTDTVSVRNIRLESASASGNAMDTARECATDPNTDKTKYTNYANVMLGADGYYHLAVEKDGSTVEGALILADLTGPTPWTSLRYGINSIEKDDKNNTEYYRSLYYLTYWQFGSAPGTSNFNYKGVDYEQIMIDHYYMQMFSDNGLVPVYPELKDMIQGFAETFAAKTGKAVYDEMWLEFCYYFDHTGQAHDKCSVTNDPVRGMNIRNAIEIEANADNIDEGVITTANIYRPIQVNRGVRFKFTAPKSGVYSLRSLSDSDLVDPFIYLRQEVVNEETGKTDIVIIQEQDISRNYDRFVIDPATKNFKYGDNFQIYFYLEEGEVVYPTIALYMPGDTGMYDFEIKYVGEQYSNLTMATTSEGLWSYDEITGELYYLAVETAYSEKDGYYRHVNSDYNLASPMYIDFIHGTFFDANNHSILDMINNGIFDYSDIGGADYSQKMMQFYYASIEGKDESDPLYGMHLATQDLIDMLDMIIFEYLEEGPSSMAWRQMSCYFEYYGPSGENPWID